MPSCNLNGSITPRSLYIHIPFCATLCYYCDFNTYTFRKKLSENYLIAKVLLDQQSPFLKSMIINKGYKHGIKLGVAVKDQSYYVG